MTPSDARGNKERNRVRLFTYKDFTEGIRDEKWDRVKFNCTQPFNSHKYGLAHVSVYGPEDETKKEMIDLNETVKKPIVRLPQKVALGKFGMRSESPERSAVGSSFTPRKETSTYRIYITADMLNLYMKTCLNLKVYNFVSKRKKFKKYF